MDPLIEAHVTSTYTPEVGVCMFEAFALLDNFDVQDYQADLVAHIMQSEAMHREQAVDGFRELVCTWIDFVFKHHMVEVTPGCPLRKRVAILSALYAVQDMQDYTTVAVCLESDQDPLEKFAFIVSELTELTEEEVLEHLEHVDPLTLDNLYRYAVSKGGGDSDDEMSEEAVREIVSKVNLFKQFSRGEDLLGSTLIDNGALLNQPFQRYLPYITGYFDEVSKTKDGLALARDVFSLLLISSDGKSRPFDVYKENSGRLFSNSVLVTKVDVALVTVVGQFIAFMEAYKNEKARLP